MKYTVTLDLISQIVGKDLKSGEKALFTENEYEIKDGELVYLSLTNAVRVNLSKVAPRLAELTHLTRLDLSGLQLDDISPLAKLPNLLYLDLSDNRLVDISPLATLTKLKGLNLSKNLLSSVEALLHCRHLAILILSNNQLSSLPSSFFQLPFFVQKHYSIHDVEFAKGCFVNLMNIDRIRVAREYARTITQKLGASKIEYEGLFKEALLSSFLEGNPMVDPPLGIISQGEKAVKNYFAQLDKTPGDAKYLHEAKLMVIGGGGTGKTTFMRKMGDVDAAMPNEEDTTLGIEVGSWTFTTRQHMDFEREPIVFYVNMWDFGGQRIYQGTHQMFFTDKSFYVLVGDTREQKTDFTYWLNTVDQLGGNNSFLVIVLNKKFGHEEKIDESGYKAHFGGFIREIVQLDLKTDMRKLFELQDIIKKHLRQLPGIGDKLPPAWVDIRDELSRDRNNFITFDRFRQICAGYDIKDASVISTLSGYFSRIGVFTHHIDEPLLRERIYLNSNWLVKTVYEVLDNEIAKEKKGRVTLKDVQEIWKKSELYYEIDQLSQLMHKFGLMYRIPMSDDFVIPARLPTLTPYEIWPHAAANDILRFVYEFDKYMPQGIMSRLIVALHHHIKDHTHVWHRGVNVESNGAVAEIVESYGGSNRFEIRIAGVNKIELLAIIRERFGEVLKPFKRLRYSQLVPCSCSGCARSTEGPAFHEYDRLLRFREMGAGSQCSRTGDLINVDELLAVTQAVQGKPVTARKSQKSATTVKIFLASSAELKEDRDALRLYISHQNDKWHKNGVYIELVQWEFFLDVMSKTRLQDEYNKALKECDIFLSLFFTKVGKFTEEEFEQAFGQFRETGRPFVYTYFKNVPVNYDEVKEEDVLSKFRFEKKLRELGHFKTNYTSAHDLENQIREQLDRLIPVLLK